MASTALLAPKCGACRLSSKSLLNSSNAESSTQIVAPSFCKAALTLPGSNNVRATLGSKRLCQIRPLQRMFREAAQSHRCGVRAQAAPSSGVAEDVREDDVLPDSLHGAVYQSAEAAARLFDSGGDRALVELLFPELESMANEGDQQRLWDLCKEFVLAFQEKSGIEKLRVVFADMGAAAMLAHKWADAPFTISSLNDRKPVQDDDEAAILVSPDHTALRAVEKVVKAFDEHEFVRPLVLWNPRLISGDVGVGLNVRNLRQGMLGTFTVAYSLKSLPNGSVYRSYPDPWKVFFADSKLPGRYNLAGVSDERPGPDQIERLAMGESARDSGREEPTTVDKAAGVINSFSRFMKSLSQ
ncbi:hypothetical protein KFL_000520220 [Klebsormidium nitens]|uniref:DUF1995 domain-containing protein n=1 Tax=Klebsormidium nitens TaxID=105231 RepID=A0A1Y1HNY1_KLENI|nr:hypothetical protein KFL_000520220 [Klebsormidium nitens]|eukprot:GAQ80350.1 hypothetical protein KFL_000520220 [Klebsormidium nitens]